MLVPRRSQEDRRLETTAALIRAGRGLFGSQGYSAVGLDALARAAGVTSGAVYHHYRGKDDLFEHVFESVESELATAVRHAARRPAAAPLVRLERGALAFLEAARDPGVRRIVMVDGPSVLGWEHWREIDERHHLRPLIAVLSLAKRAGALGGGDPHALARLLMGALTEAALDGGTETQAAVIWLIRLLR